MTEASRTILIAALSVAAGMTWQALRTAAIPLTSPDRLIAELRLAQIAALVLMATAGSYLGFAAAHEAQPGTGLDIALTLGFGVLAGVTLLRDPRQAPDAPRPGLRRPRRRRRRAPARGPPRRRGAALVCARVRGVQRLRRGGHVLADSETVSFAALPPEGGSHQSPLGSRCAAATHVQQRGFRLQPEGRCQ